MIFLVNCAVATKETLQPVVTLVVGICAAAIAAGQWKVAIDKQKHEVASAKFQQRLALFDRRYKVYKSAMSLISLMTMSGSVTLDEIHNCARDTAESQFLFGPEIKLYIDDLLKRAKDVWACNRILNSPNSEIQNYSYRVSTAEKLNSLLKQSGNDFDKCTRLADRYLSFESNR